MIDSGQLAPQNNAPACENKNTYADIDFLTPIAELAVKHLRRWSKNIELEELVRAELPTK